MVFTLALNYGALSTAKDVGYLFSFKLLIFHSDGGIMIVPNQLNIFVVRAIFIFVG
jgi:hypothetical protein